MPPVVKSGLHPLLLAVDTARVDSEDVGAWIDSALHETGALFANRDVSHSPSMPADPEDREPVFVARLQLLHEIVLHVAVEVTVLVGIPDDLFRVNTTKGAPKPNKR